MALITMSEYMNSKGKTIENPPEKTVAGDVEGSCNDNDKNPKLKNVEKKGKSGVLQVKENMTDIVDATQVFKLARDIASENPKYMEKLVREFKNSGVLASLVAELMMHKETYNFIAELMGNKVYGEQISKNLARAMLSEDVAPPFHKSNDDESLEDDDLDDGEMGMPHHHEPDGDEMGGMGDDDGDEMDHGDGDGDDDDMGDDLDSDDDGSDDDMSQYADPDLGDDNNMDDLGGEGGMNHPGMANPKMPMRKPMPQSFENFNKAIGKLFGERIKK